MECRKEKLTITLEEDKKRMEEEIKELDKLLDILDKNPQQCILAGKTQFIGKTGKSNRSRYEHSENINIIAKEIIEQIYEKVVPEEIKKTDIYKLNLQIAEKYVHIMSKTHDIGHTPYGHLGESVLNEFVSEQKISAEDTKKILKKRKKIFGKEYEKRQGHIEKYRGAISFEHNEKSAEIVYGILHDSNIDLEKIDANRIIKGILAHSTSRVKEDMVPADLVIQAVRRTDKIEYTNKDVEEIKKYINIESLEDDEVKEFINKPIKERVEEIIGKIVDCAIKSGKIDGEIPELKLLKKVDKIKKDTILFMEKDGKQGLIIDENSERISLMINRILKYYMDNIEETQIDKVRLVHPINQELEEKKQKIEIKLSKLDETNIDKLITFICNMDDNQLKQKYMELVKKRIVKGKGNGVEPISKKEIQKKKKKNISKKVIRMQQKMIVYNEVASYSKTECINILQNENERYFNEVLTDTGREQIKRTIKKHKKENEIDNKLIELMKDADKRREELKEKEFSASEKRKYGESVKQIERERILITKITNSKEFWEFIICCINRCT